MRRPPCVRAQFNYLSSGSCFSFSLGAWWRTGCSGAFLRCAGGLPHASPRRLRWGRSPCFGLDSFVFISGHFRIFRFFAGFFFSFFRGGARSSFWPFSNFSLFRWFFLFVLFFSILGAFFFSWRAGAKLFGQSVVLFCFLFVFCVFFGALAAFSAFCGFVFVFLFCVQPAHACGVLVWHICGEVPFEFGRGRLWRDFATLLFFLFREFLGFQLRKIFVLPFTSTCCLTTALPQLYHSQPRTFPQPRGN